MDDCQVPEAQKIHFQKPKLFDLVSSAERRAKRMERQIADRLAQGNYEKAMDAFVEDFVTYPAAILKGPVYARHKTLEWGEGFKPIVRNDPAPTWERVSPFDAYPAALSAADAIAAPRYCKACNPA